MQYKLIDLFFEDVTIAESDNIAELWTEIDNQHFMVKPSLVIVKDGEIVAGAARLLDTMTAHKAWTPKLLLNAIKS